MQQRRMSGVTRMYEKLKTLKDKLQKMKTNRANRQIGQTFHFSPFSRKQKQVLTWWCKESPVHDMDGVIADGAIRSGKTISMGDTLHKMQVIIEATTEPLKKGMENSRREVKKSVEEIQKETEKVKNPFKGMLLKACRAEMIVDGNSTSIWKAMQRNCLR